MEYTQATKIIPDGEYTAVLKFIQVVPKVGEAYVELVFEIEDGSKSPAILACDESWPTPDSQLDRMVQLVKQRYGVREWGLQSPHISSLPIGYRFRVEVASDRQVGRRVTDEWCFVTRVLGVADAARGKARAHTCAPSHRESAAAALVPADDLTLGAPLPGVDEFH